MRLSWRLRASASKLSYGASLVGSRVTCGQEGHRGGEADSGASWLCLHEALAAQEGRPAAIQRTAHLRGDRRIEHVSDGTFAHPLCKVATSLGNEARRKPRQENAYRLAAKIQDKFHLVERVSLLSLASLSNSLATLGLRHLAYSGLQAF